MATTMEGPLSKWTNVMKGWQYRWFVLDGSTGLLSYYTSKDKMMRGSRRGCVRLKTAVIGIDDEDDSTFTLTCDQKTFHFQARDGDERERWIRALEDNIMRHSRPSTAPLVTTSSKIGTTPSLADFDKKLLETDAYLQILIEQLQVIDTRLKSCDNLDIRSKLETIRHNANEMIESIKHSIVMLQIAKSQLSPSSSDAEPAILKPDDFHALPPSSVKGVDEEAREAVENNITGYEQTPLRNSISEGVLIRLFTVPAIDEEHEKVKGASAFSTSLTLPTENLGALVEQQVNVHTLVPEVSYSSSEDEYYDADEFEDAQSAEKSPKHFPDSSPLSACDPTTAEGQDSHGHLKEVRPALEKASISVDELDVDSIYNDDEEDELGSVEEHGSIIMHLLSQVRIGMDLTKVVLPTFILEKRSLLEMYADFFAHPDLFVKIPNHEDPKSRMVAVVRWYLSAFHAGRKGTVAKKPYNPLLGEVFYCYWPTDRSQTSIGCTELSDDGPVPWATRDNLCLIAEQVSHHPPISAFYAEHYNKRISLNAHIWTKSKFLGLSIGVHMIGQGCLALLDHGEEYIITFPNGYGRSILTVPWIELGGRITIMCSKTGYSATIDFLTKPFYGGKKHRIQAEVMQTGKKPFLTVTGEWNGIMVAKHEKTGRTEVFVDTKHMPVIKKQVKPVSEQGPYESRRLWKDVTAALTIRDVEKATEHKYFLEQRQRAEAKERKEKGAKVETKFFHENGENWIYDRPLQKRLAEAGISTKPLED